MKSVKHVLVFSEKLFFQLFFYILNIQIILKYSLKKRIGYFKILWARKWENAKAEDSWSKIYFTHVLRSRWGIENAKRSCRKLILGAFREGKNCHQTGAETRLPRLPLSVTYLAPAKAKKQDWVAKGHFFACGVRKYWILGKQNRRIPE